jgi:hypothetical protein
MGLGFVFKSKLEGWDESTDRHPGIPDLGENNWSALYFDVLGCPESDLPAPGEDMAEYWERVRLKFQQAIPAYPMLGRIWDFYNDAWYAPEEVGQLQSECLKVQTNTANQTALEGLGLLLRACDEVSADKLGIFLAAD